MSDESGASMNSDAGHTRCWKKVMLARKVVLTLIAAGKKSGVGPQRC